MQLLHDRLQHDPLQTSHPHPYSLLASPEWVPALNEPASRRQPASQRQPSLLPAPRSSIATSQVRGAPKIDDGRCASVTAGEVACCATPKNQPRTYQLSCRSLLLNDRRQSASIASAFRCLPLPAGHRWARLLESRLQTGKVTARTQEKRQETQKRDRASFRGCR